MKRWTKMAEQIMSELDMLWTIKLRQLGVEVGAPVPRILMQCVVNMFVLEALKFSKH